MDGIRFAIAPPTRRPPAPADEFRATARLRLEAIQPNPGPDPGLTQMREAVIQGQSPFGYYDDDQGQLVKAEEGLSQALTAWAESPDDSFLSGPPGQKAGRQWLYNCIHGQSNPPGQAM